MPTAKYKILILIAVLFFLGFGDGYSGVSRTAAQIPCPRVGPCDTPPTPTPVPTPIIPGIPGDPATLSSFLEALITNFVLFKTVFIRTVEGTLGGYFAILAYILAWVIAVYYFIQQFIQGEWDAAQIGRFTGSIVVCLLLLVFCGDVNNDGRRGDLVQMPAWFGYYLAFGEDRQEPTGSFINRLVNTERSKFNDNYKIFIENKLMVKINGHEMPVRYPGATGIQTVAAVAIGDAKPEQEKSFLSQELWIGVLFQVMNFFRSIIEIIDFFLLVLYAFGILVCGLIAPFMCAVFVNRDLRKRFTYPFMWTILTVTVIFPVMSQVFRYFAYLSSNIALGSHGNPVYTFNPQNFTITANGDPTPMILVAVLTMLISIVLLVMSLILSYSFAQGKLVESMSGLIANTFAGLSSIGVGAAVSAYATKLGGEGERRVIEDTEKAALEMGDHVQRGQQYAAEKSLLSNRVQTDGGYLAAGVAAQGERKAEEESLVGKFLTSAMGVQTEQIASKQTAQAGHITQMRTLEDGLREDLIRKAWGSEMDRRRITDEGQREVLLQQSGLLNLPGDIYDNQLASSSIFGGIISQFMNGKTFETLQGAGGRNRGGVPGSREFDNSKIPDIKMPGGENLSFKDFVDNNLAPVMPKTGGTGGATDIPSVGMNVPNSGFNGGGIQFGGGFQTSGTYRTQKPVSESDYVTQDGTPMFRQGDAQWGDRELGTGGSLSKAGCAVTSMAMAMSKISGKPITPKVLDSHLDSNKGYSGNAIKWGVAADAAGLDAQKQPWSLDTINRQIDSGRPVVAGIDYKPGSNGGANGTDHWLAITGRQQTGNGQSVYTAVDPATGKQIQLQQEGNRLVGDGNYKTSGQLVTFSGGSPQPRGFMVANSNGNAAVGGGGSISLGAPGIPNIPKTLLEPLSASTSRKAANMDVKNPGYVYYHPSQEAAYQSTGNKQIDGLILGAARTHQLNPNMLKAQFWQESKLQSGATSHKGAKGVAQLMPGTAKEVGVTNVRDAAQSIYGGAKYMRFQADYMAGKGGIKDGETLRSTALAGYNAGHGAVEERGFTVPRFSETQGYVTKISKAIDDAPLSKVKSPEEIKRHLSTLSRPEAEVYGKAYGNLYGTGKALERNSLDNDVSQAITRQSYANKGNTTAANTQMMYEIADNKARNQMVGVQTDLNYGRQSADTRYETKAQVAEINRSTGYQSGQHQYEGSIGQAALQYEGTKESARITKEAALEALHKRNMASLVQSVGGSVSHQLSELFERASRGL